MNRRRLSDDTATEREYRDTMEGWGDDLPILTGRAFLTDALAWVIAACTISACMGFIAYSALATWGPLQ